MPVSVRRHNLVRVRDELNLTQADLGLRINRSGATIKSIETGRLALSKDLAALIADATGVDANWLLRNDLSEPMPPLKHSLAILQPADLAYDLSCLLLQHLFDRLFLALGRLGPSQERSFTESLIRASLDNAKTIGHEPEGRPLQPIRVGTLEFFKKHPEFLDTDLASWINLNFLIKDAYRVQRQIKLSGYPVALGSEPVLEPAKSRRRKSPGRSPASHAPSDRHKSSRSSASQRDGVR